MSDPFAAVDTQRFIDEETASITNKTNIGELMATIAVGRSIQLFANAMTNAGIIGGVTASDNTAESIAHGRIVIARGFALLAVCSMLTMRDTLRRCGVTDELPEVDLISNWYISRYRPEKADA